MTAKGDDVRFFIKRVRDVAVRLEAIVDKAAAERVQMIDGLNRQAASKSVSTLEILCNDLEIRIERRRKMRRAG
jgi:hypothetical protein